MFCAIEPPYKYLSVYWKYRNKKMGVFAQEPARIGHGRRGGRLSQPSRMSLLTTMTTSEKAIQKSMTSPRRSVHQTSFLWASFACQELIRSTTHRFVAHNGAGLPLS